MTNDTRPTEAEAPELGIIDNDQTGAAGLSTPPLGATGSAEQRPDDHQEADMQPDREVTQPTDTLGTGGSASAGIEQIAVVTFREEPLLGDDSAHDAGNDNGDKGSVATAPAHAPSKTKGPTPMEDIERFAQEGTTIEVVFKKPTYKGNTKEITGVYGFYLGSVRVHCALRDRQKDDTLESLLDGKPKEVRILPLEKNKGVSVSRKLSDEDIRRDRKRFAHLRERDAERARIAAFDAKDRAEREAFESMPALNTWIDATVKNSGFHKGQRFWRLNYEGKPVDVRLPSKHVPQGFPADDLKNGKPLHVRIAWKDTETRRVTVSLKEIRDPGSPSDGANRKEQRHEKPGKRDNARGKPERTNDHAQRQTQASSSVKLQTFDTLPECGTQITLKVTRVRYFDKEKTRWAAFCNFGPELDLYLPNLNAPQGTVLEVGQEVNPWLVAKDREKLQATLSLLGADQNPSAERGHGSQSERREGQPKAGANRRDGAQNDRGANRSQGNRQNRNEGDRKDRNRSGEGEGRNERKPRREERRGGNPHREQEAAGASATVATGERSEASSGPARADRPDCPAGGEGKKAGAAHSGNGAQAAAEPVHAHGDLDVNAEGIVIGVHDLRDLHLMGKPAPKKPEPAPKAPKVKKVKAAAPAATDAATAETDVTPPPVAEAQTVGESTLVTEEPVADAAPLTEKGERTEDHSE